MSNSLSPSVILSSRVRLARNIVDYPFAPVLNDACRKEIIQKVANTLREIEKCDAVICLSHQGTHPGIAGNISDMELAEKTENIDVIIGAHTHKIVENLYVTNLNGDSVLLAQSGKAGARIGKIALKIAQ